MEQQNLFKGRDRRKKGWFWMDNDYLNGYARYFGAVGTAIYVSLCRHANNENQQCFPAMGLVAEEIGIHINTVSKYIRFFKKYNLISISREKDPATKRWKNNVYTLLDKEGWKKPPTPVVDGTTHIESECPPTSGVKSHPQPLWNKETTINKTYIKENSFNKLKLLNELKLSLKEKGIVKQ